MPVEALGIISEVLNKLARGVEPALMVLDEAGSLTTQQAADLLGVSRPHLIQMLVNEHIPHHRRDAPRSRRYIDRDAILELKGRREGAGRRMDELMALSSDLAD